MPYADPDKQRDFQKKWKRRTKDWFWEYKSTLSCSRCGFSHPAAIQFHHVGGKDAEVSRMIQKNSNRELIMAEIAKCEIVCANCHFIAHYEQNYKSTREGLIRMGGPVVGL